MNMVLNILQNLKFIICQLNLPNVPENWRLRFVCMIMYYALSLNLSRSMELKTCSANNWRFWPLSAMTSGCHHRSNRAWNMADDKISLVANLIIFFYAFDSWWNCKVWNILCDFGYKVHWPMEVTRVQIELGIWQLLIKHTQIDKIRIVASFDHCFKCIWQHINRINSGLNWTTSNPKFNDLWRSPEVR